MARKVFMKLIFLYNMLGKMSTVCIKFQCFLLYFAYTVFPIFEKFLYIGDCKFVSVICLNTYYYNK